MLILFFSVSLGSLHRFLLPHSVLLQGLFRTRPLISYWMPAVHGYPSCRQSHSFSVSCFHSGFPLSCHVMSKGCLLNRWFRAAPTAAPACETLVCCVSTFHSHNNPCVLCTHLLGSALMLAVSCYYDTACEYKALNTSVLVVYTNGLHF